jgi:hypothetical protein
VKAALPSHSFAVGAVIAIAVRAVQTIIEVVYVGAVTLLGRREAWTESPHELAEDVRAEARAMAPRPGPG